MEPLRAVAARNTGSTGAPTSRSGPAGGLTRMGNTASAQEATLILQLTQEALAGHASGVEEADGHLARPLAQLVDALDLLQGTHARLLVWLEVQNIADGADPVPGPPPPRLP